MPILRRGEPLRRPRSPSPAAAGPDAAASGGTSHRPPPPPPPPPLPEDLLFEDEVPVPPTEEYMPASSSPVRLSGGEEALERQEEVLDSRFYIPN